MENIIQPSNYYSNLAATIYQNKVAPLQKVISDLEKLEEDENIKIAIDNISNSLSKATAEYLTAKKLWESFIDSENNTDKSRDLASFIIKSMKQYNLHSETYDNIATLSMVDTVKTIRKFIESSRLKVVNYNETTKTLFKFVTFRPQGFKKWEEVHKWLYNVEVTLYNIANKK